MTNSPHSESLKIWSAIMTNALFMANVIFCFAMLCVNELKSGILLQILSNNANNSMYNSM